MGCICLRVLAGAMRREDMARRCCAGARAETATARTEEEVKADRNMARNVGIFRCRCG